MIKKLIFILNVLFIIPVYSNNYENTVANIEKNENTPKEKITKKEFIDIYNKAKNFFFEKDYEKANENFSKLIDPEFQTFEYLPYTIFYYSLSNYYLNQKEVADSSLNFLLENFKEWDQIDEVKLWLAKLEFEEHNYFKALLFLNTFKNKQSLKFFHKMEEYYLHRLDNLKKFYKIFINYPKQAIIRKIFIAKLLNCPYIDLHSDFFQNLISQYNLDFSEVKIKLLKSKKKQLYEVGIFLPLFQDKMTSKFYKNKLVLNFYKGVVLALDKLKENNINIKLYVYDTKRDLATTEELLQNEEIKSLDLVIGPLYPKTVKIVSQFCLENQINMVNPFSYNRDIILYNPFIFLFRPSIETQATKAAQYIIYDLEIKNLEKVNNKTFDGTSRVGIIYGSDLEDVKKVKSFKKCLDECLNKKLDLILKLDKESVTDLLKLFRKDKKYSKFSFKENEDLEEQRAIFDNIEYLYVATDNKLIINSILTILQMRKLKIKIIGSQKWIDFQSIDFNKLQSSKAILIAPNYVDCSRESFVNYRKRYYETFLDFPDYYAHIGYELMSFFGLALHKFGNFFQNNWDNDFYKPSIFSKIFYDRFQSVQDCKIVSLEKGYMVPIELKNNKCLTMIKF